MGAFVCVPISAEIYNELVIRSGKPDVDVAGTIENVVNDFLDRTADDGDWSDAYYQWRSSTKNSKAFEAEFGDPKRGYQWGPLFLPNGTKLSMNYKGRTYHALVHHEQVWYDGKAYSPSELARVIASNTSRNAWRDLMVKRPQDERWVLADELRRPTRSVAELLGQLDKQ